jgi:hypothetical protein
MLGLFFCNSIPLIMSITSIFYQLFGFTIPSISESGFTNSFLLVTFTLPSLICYLVLNKFIQKAFACKTLEISG